MRRNVQASKEPPKPQNLEPASPNPSKHPNQAPRNNQKAAHENPAPHPNRPPSHSGPPPPPPPAPPPPKKGTPPGGGGAPPTDLGCGLYFTFRVFRLTSFPVPTSRIIRVSEVVNPGAPLVA